MNYLTRALIEALLIGGLCGAVGTHVVLRRQPFFVAALTHSTFPGAVLASLAGVSIYLGAGASALIMAAVAAGLGRVRGQGAATAAGVVLASGFALGVVLQSTQDGFARDLNSFLVGSILTVSNTDLWTAFGALVVVLLILAAIGKELLFGAFDPSGFRAAGYRAWAYDFVLLLLVALTAVTAMPAVGTILALALIVAPAAAARLWTHRVWPMTIASMTIGMACGAGGLYLADATGRSAGGVITLFAAAIFIGSLVMTSIRVRIRT